MFYIATIAKNQYAMVNEILCQLYGSVISINKIINNFKLIEIVIMIND